VKLGEKILNKRAEMDRRRSPAPLQCESTIDWHHEFDFGKHSRVVIVPRAFGIAYE
jgi:hypothetical protein